MNSLKSALSRMAGLAMLALIVCLALTIRPSSAAVTAMPQTVDIIANSAAVKTASGELLETCVITVDGTTFPMQLGPCKELGESLLQDLQRDYPTVVFNLTVNGFSYNTI